MRKRSALIAALSIGLGTFGNPALAEIIKTDAGLAGKTFCWSEGYDQEKYGRDHTYVYFYRQGSSNYDQPVSQKGTWSITKDGTVTLKLAGGTQIRRYDFDGEHVKELTNSLFNYGGGPGKRC